MGIWLAQKSEHCVCDCHIGVNHHCPGTLGESLAFLMNSIRKAICCSMLLYYDIFQFLVLLPLESFWQWPHLVH